MSNSDKLCALNMKSTYRWTNFTRLIPRGVQPTRICTNTDKKFTRKFINWSSFSCFIATEYLTFPKTGNFKSQNRLILKKYYKTTIYNGCSTRFNCRRDVRNRFQWQSKLIADATFVGDFNANRQNTSMYPHSVTDTSRGTVVEAFIALYTYNDLLPMSLEQDRRSNRPIQIQQLDNWLVTFGVMLTKSGGEHLPRCVETTRFNTPL